MKIQNLFLASVLTYSSLAVSADKREGEYWIITGKPPKALGGNFRVVLGERGKLEKITHTK